MARKVATDRPLSFEEHGVIGSESVASDVKAPVNDGVARSESRPADASVVEEAETRPAPFEKREERDEDTRPVLPEGFQEWEGFKLANGSARDSFAFVIRYPGSVFTAPGRYHNAQKVAEFYDVEPDHIVPDGLYLIPTNYLINQDAQGAVLRGTRAPERAPRVNPLRSSKSEE